MPQEELRILILGNGGREHALYLACKKSPLAAEVFVAPGNGGIPMVDSRPVDLNSIDDMVGCARATQADLVIVGPEAPLALGVADDLRKAGFLVYGPGKKGAQLEASKVFCKAFFQRHNIPTADYAQFDEIEAALAHVSTLRGASVVKASGLAAGKGVFVCSDTTEAEAAVRTIMEHRAFGISGNEVIIEECLEGPEVSIMVMVSGSSFCCLPPSQDHKRIGEGDTGPNTGGMGAYAPAGVVTPALQKQIEDTIVAPSVAGMESEGFNFRGTLFIGLMLTGKGPQVLEFNVRFGDPECQVLLPLCSTDPLELIIQCARGEPLPEQLPSSNQTAAIVVLAAKGYPDSYVQGDPIGLPEDLPENVHIVHAGTRRIPPNGIVSAGGRVLGVVARAQTLEEATRDAYAVCNRVEWTGKTFRRDIGWRQLATQRDNRV